MLSREKGAFDAVPLFLSPDPYESLFCLYIMLAGRLKLINRLPLT